MAEPIRTGVIVAAPEDLSRFCAAEYPRLVGALDLYLCDLAIAEEIAQEALIKAASRWERVKRLDSPGGWTRRVAMNMATSHLRRRQAERRARARLETMAVHQSGEERTDLAEVRRAVSRLPAKQREAVVLRFFLDLTAADAARTMGCSEQAIRALTSRAAVHLRNQLHALSPGGTADG